MMKVDITKNAWIDSRSGTILKYGVRRNTHKPLSKLNPRRPIKEDQARAIAEKMWVKRGA